LSVLLSIVCTALLIALVKMSHRDRSDAFVPLANTEVCTNAQTRGHNRADSRRLRAHDDVASGKQEGCGLDEFGSFLLQRR